MQSIRQKGQSTKTIFLSSAVKRTNDRRLTPFCKKILKNLLYEHMFIIFAPNVCSFCMSPSFKRPRKILSPPIIKGFKPFGGEADKHNSEPILLLFEEYEALRLCDYDMLTHHQAGAAMGVSRPTFTRIYASVRQKLAQAFAECRQIIIEGGKVYFDSEWYHCNQCGCYFNHPEPHTKAGQCPLCGSYEIAFSESENGLAEESTEVDDFCFCPTCGRKAKHHYGSPGNQMICPDCNTQMRRNRMRGCKNR